MKNPGFEVFEKVNIKTTRVGIKATGVILALTPDEVNDLWHFSVMIDQKGEVWQLMEHEIEPQGNKANPDDIYSDDVIKI